MFFTINYFLKIKILNHFNFNVETYLIINLSMYQFILIFNFNRNLHYFLNLFHPKTNLLYFMNNF